MRFGQLDGLGWLLLILLPFLYVQRQLHRDFQAILLIIFRHPGISLGIFSLFFFPGVMLHELSHYLMALLLRVRAIKFSLIPQTQPDGRLQLGYVEIQRTDFLRDAIIGAAPLLSGGVVVACIGVFALDLVPAINLALAKNWGGFFSALLAIPQRPDFWLWFYLGFVFSSMMMPSTSDRRAWLPMIMVGVVLWLVAESLGATPWLEAHVVGPLNEVMRSMALVLLLSLLIHVVLIVPISGLRFILVKITGAVITVVKKK